MTRLSASLWKNIPPYPASMAAAAAAAVIFAAIQLLCWQSRRAVWIRLMPLWLALCAAGASLLCVINLFHPHEMGYILFCALACVLGCLAGLVLGGAGRT